MIITIDGPAGTGKSTVAKQLATHLGFTYFDTGAMYRTITYAIISNHIDYQDLEALDLFLSSFKPDIRSFKGVKRDDLRHEHTTPTLRSSEVNALVSQISAIPQVRQTLVHIQHQIGNGVNAVFEGRDMGTVVFPKADLKIFLTATPEIRAERRYLEMIAKNPEARATLSKEEILKEINERDHYDSNRAISPLRQAADAFLIDTSELSVDDVVNIILEYKDQLKFKKAKN